MTTDKEEEGASAPFTSCKTKNPLIGNIVDPPEGWKYGFPRPYTPEEGEDDEAWFLRMGYPQELIDQGMLKHCRWWRPSH